MADSELERFVRAYLHSGAQRGVYVALASSRDDALSAASIAERADAEVHEIDVVLRQFAAAGIVEQVDVQGGGRRYRWAPEMGHLRDAELVPGGPVDPVCGMPVAEDGPYVEVSGESAHHFCSFRCQTVWRVLQRGKVRMRNIP